MENIWIAGWRNCDWVGKIDLFILFMLSIYSWALMIEKHIIFRRILRANKTFLKNFYDDKIGGGQGSIWERVLSRTMREKAKTQMSEEKLMNFLKRCGNDEILPLAAKLDFLLTISAVAPFMGLLGTVWGILMAFHHMGLTGSSSISVIASGVSEALIVTFVGLLVAIPTALGYNYLNEKLKRIQIQGEEILEAFYISLK